MLLFSYCYQLSRMGPCPRFFRHSVRFFSNGSGAWTACPLQLTTAGFAKHTAQRGCWKHAVIVECHVFAMHAACEWLGTAKGACIHFVVSSIEHTSGQVRGRSCAACERNGDWEKAGMCLCSKPSWLRGGVFVCTFSRWKKSLGSICLRGTSRRVRTKTCRQATCSASW